MKSDWQELTRLTGGRPFVVERVRLAGSAVAIEGEFEPSSLACLSAQDQVFVAAFVRSHGSIKRMEEMFGVSYPTVKNRLNRISERLEFVEMDATPSKADVLAALEEGELSVEEALRRLKP
jgi:hypothetical protein